MEGCWAEGWMDNHDIMTYLQVGAEKGGWRGQRGEGCWTRGLEG